MFTGLVSSPPYENSSHMLKKPFFPHVQIEHMGTVSSILPLDNTESGGGGWSITISDSAQILDDCHIGDSIAVNGTCLTVTEHGKDDFKIGLAPETLEKTDLGKKSSCHQRSLLIRQGKVC